MKPLVKAFVLVVFSVLTACASPIQGEVGRSSAIVKDLALQFNTIDAFARLIAFENFEKRVPPHERAALLDEVWAFVEDKPELADARLSVLAYLISKGQEQMPWDDRLEERVLAASKDEAPEVRRLVLNVLIARTPPASRNQALSFRERDPILSFLEDKDDSIREAAIVEIAQWADSRPVLEDYVKANERKDEWRDSVSTAKFFLNK